MKRLTFAVILFLAAGVCAESLWKGEDLYSARIMKPGDHLRITFKSKNLMEFNTFQENYESAALNNPGAGGSAVVDFLPKVTTSFDNKTSKKAGMKNKNDIQFSITASVVSIASNGTLLISGNHSITINNQIETITVQGQVDPRYAKSGEVSSDDIGNLALVYNRTVFRKDLLTQTDFSNSTSGSNKSQSVLTDKKKKELLIKYFNQILPLLFQ
jgi:flagellar basal body L-ring protein FlgH